MNITAEELAKRPAGTRFDFDGMTGAVLVRATVGETQVAVTYRPAGSYLESRFYCQALSTINVRN